MTKKSEVLLWFVMEGNIGSRTMVNTPLAAIPFYPNPWQTPQDISSMLVITFQGFKNKGYTSSALVVCSYS